MRNRSSKTFLASALFLLFLSPYAFGAQIKLAWDPPIANVDGSPLNDLGGYKIHWGTSSGTYGDSVDVGNVTDYMLTDLIEGQTYFIAVIAYDNVVPPEESDYSNEVTAVAANPVVIDCSTFGIQPQEASFPYSGGVANISVTVPVSSCNWSAASSLIWVTITSGNIGQGNGMIEYAVSRNNNPVARNAIISISGNVFNIFQEVYPANIVVEPDSIDFGTQERGKIAEARMKISNIGSTPLNVDSVEIAGLDKSSFWVGGDCTVIPVGSHCNVVVAFAPTIGGAQSSSVVINSDDPVWPKYNVALSGVASDHASPSISVNPDFIIVPYVDIEFGVSQTIHINNNGTGSLAINSINVAGPEASEFLVNSNCTIIDPGGNCNFSMVGRYSSQKEKQISVVIASNAINAPKLEIPITVSSGLCTDWDINLSKRSQTLSNGATHGTVDVRSTGTGRCVLYAISRSSWINLSINNGSVNYDVPPNTSGLARIGDISIAGQPFTIIQNSEASDTIFNDAPGNVFDDYINAIYAAGITAGCGQQGEVLFYCPLDYVTRGQMAAFITRAIDGEVFYYPAGPYFSDVPSTHPFFKYVQKLKDTGITVVSGRYGVDDNVTRGQVAAFIIRAIYGETFHFTQAPYFLDVPDAHNFFKYVQKMKDTGITVVNEIYRVDDYITREEMAAFLARAFLEMK